MLIKAIAILFVSYTLVSASISMTEDTTFFGIPGMSELSTEWLMEISDFMKFGMIHPVDIEVLRLSPADWRLVALEADCTLFTAFPIDQQSGLDSGKVIRSGKSPADCRFATAMCPMTTNKFFKANSDRIAVAFKVGAKIGIYRFDKWTNQLVLVDSLSNQLIGKPIGIFWAFNNFFIVDEDDQTIYRTDEGGNILGQYGQPGIFGDGYRWISDIEGSVDSSNTAHLYVSDGANERIDHLTAIAGDSALYLESQATAKSVDTLGINLHETVHIPGVGVIGLNRYSQRLYHWDGDENLKALSRDDLFLPFDAIHIREALGRFLIIQLADTGKIGWTIKSYRIENSSYPNPVPAYSNTHWTSAMSPIYVTDSVIIGSGQHLTIDASVEVQFDAGTCIRVNSGGTLTVNGLDSREVLMKRMNYGETWGGIKVHGGTLDIEYVNMYDCDSACVYTNAPTQVIIENCWFDGNKMAYKLPVLSLNNAPSVTQNVTGVKIVNVPIGFGLNLSNCTIRFNEVEVSGCNEFNSFIKTTTGTFTNCQFKDRASSYGVFVTGAGTTPNFKCCVFDHISPLSGGFNCTVFAAIGSAPTFGYLGNVGGVSNVFQDSCTYIMKMYGSGVLPIIQRVSGDGPGGRNDWYQGMAAGKYISWGSPYPNPLTAYFAKSQYWDREPVSIDDFNPASTDYFTLGSGEADPWEQCGGAASSIGGRGAADLVTLDDDEEIDPLDSLFTVALALEIEEEYSSAQPLFRNVAANSTNDQLIWQAMTHIISCQRMLDPASGETWIPGMLDSLLIADTSTYGTRVYANRLLATYRLARAEYNEAIQILTDLIDSDLGAEDSLYVAMDIIGVQMAAGIGDGGGALDEHGFAGVPSTLRVSSESEGTRREWELLDELSRLLVENPPVVHAALPTEFRLYQNYPNPFNPTTQIEFDLPEQAAVILKVFNTLGQEVVTIEDQVRPAGHHLVTWNGKSNSGADVATGLYVYQITAGAYSSAKKMLLLR